eukprot:6793072-Prorocentrum_lima.AAC.1
MHGKILVRGGPRGPTTASACAHRTGSNDGGASSRKMSVMRRPPYGELSLHNMSVGGYRITW